MARMSECAKYREMIEAYVDRILDDASEKGFLAHVQQCPSCRAELEADRALAGELGSLSLQDPGRQFTDLVMERIFGEKPLPSRTGIPSGVQEAIKRYAFGFPRLAWTILAVVSFSVAFLVPALLDSGVVGFLSLGTRILSILTNPLADLAASIEKIGNVLDPLMGALFLALKVSVEFMLTIVGTQQFSFFLIASVLIVMTASVYTAFHLTMARRRIRHAEIRL